MTDGTAITLRNFVLKITPYSAAKEMERMEFRSKSRIAQWYSAGLRAG
jgi:hypothetical protein